VFSHERYPELNIPNTRNSGEVFLSLEEQSQAPSWNQC